VKLPTIPHRRSAPRPSRCVLRSQAIPPSRDSDLDSRGRQRRRRRARASRARSRSSQMSRITRPSSAGAAANRSIAASASARSFSVPRSSRVSTRTPVAGGPHPSSCPSRTIWSTAARMSGIATSLSPRRALSRARYTSTIGKSQRLYPGRRSTWLTLARTCCPRSRSAVS